MYLNCMIKDINFPLVEDKRPPIYTAMKYWGKKPHNIWSSYINTYTNKKNNVILDPFSGSAIAAFEAVKIKRKAFAFDINPLTAFTIEVLTSYFSEDKFKSQVGNILSKLEKDSVYKKYYTSKCPNCHRLVDVQHYKWENDEIYELGIICPYCKTRHLIKPSLHDVELSKKQISIDIPFWYPKEKFYNSSSFTNSFIVKIGGDCFGNIWTRRNLYVLSFIYSEILKIEDINLKRQLLYGFIQIVHLASKMCVPRRADSNRSFSTSWGRPAYLCSDRQMEMNPCLLFKNSCLGKQSVISSLRCASKYFDKQPKILDVKTITNKVIPCDVDIVYGTIPIQNIGKYVRKESVDFIITDPPYGGLIQYMDLSYIWTIWLQHFDGKYCVDIQKEITIKSGDKDINDFSKEFTFGVKQLYNVLKNNGKIVFTFNNKDLSVWKALLKSIQDAGFFIEKVIYQPNKRTGESNVKDLNGTSANDYYIRCVKKIGKFNRTESDYNYNNYIVDKVQGILKKRMEPTSLHTLFVCFLQQVSFQGFNLENFDTNFSNIIMDKVGSIFELCDGKIWLKEYKYIEKKSLTYKLKKFISSSKNNCDELSFLQNIYKKFNNDLFPERDILEQILKK